MSTPIEIVRAYQAYLTTGEYMPHSPEAYDAALAAVLADAERFAALGAAHLNPPFKGSIAVKVFDPERFEYVLHKGELSELADQLRKDKQ